MGWWWGAGFGGVDMTIIFLYMEPGQRINGYYPSTAERKGSQDGAVIGRSQRHAAVFEHVGQCGNTADNRRINAQMLRGVVVVGGG